MPYTDLHVSVYFAKLEGKIQIKELTLQLCYEHRLYRLLAVRPWRTQGCLLYLVALLHLPSFFRFDVLVTIHLYDLL